VSREQYPGSGISVVIADHDPLVRSALTHLLEAEPDFTVLAAEPNGECAVASVTALKPDILLADVLLPSVSWLHVAVSYRSVTTRPVLMCTRFDHRLVLEGMYRGVLGVWMKEHLSLLSRCLRCVATGGYWDCTHEVADIALMIRRIEDEAPERAFRLAARQQQAVRLISTNCEALKASRRIRLE